MTSLNTGFAYKYYFVLKFGVKLRNITKPALKANFQKDNSG